MKIIMNEKEYNAMVKYMSPYFDISIFPYKRKETESGVVYRLSILEEPSIGLFHELESLVKSAPNMLRGKIISEINQFFKNWIKKYSRG